MSAYLLGIYEKAMPNSFTLRRKLETAAKYHYDFMELSIDETSEKLGRLNWTKEEREALRRCCDEVGVPIRTICLSGHRKYPLGSPDAAVRARSLQIMEQAIELACDLGVRIIQLAGYDVYYEQPTLETQRLFLEGLQKSVQLAAKYGVILAFETMETPFLDTVWKAMKWVQAIESPYLQVYPDIGNCTNAAKLYKTDMLMDLRSGKGHIAALHLKETLPGRYREVEYGEGHVDFIGAIRTAQKMGVSIFVTEFWDVPGIDTEEHIAYSRKFIQNEFDMAQGQTGMARS